MTTIGLIFIVFALIVLVSPWLAGEDRPDFIDPEGKARAAVGNWFARRTR